MHPKQFMALIVCIVLSIVLGSIIVAGIVTIELRSEESRRMSEIQKINAIMKQTFSFKAPSLSNPITDAERQAHELAERTYQDVVNSPNMSEYDKHLAQITHEAEEIAWQQRLQESKGP